MFLQSTEEIIQQWQRSILWWTRYSEATLEELFAVDRVSIWQAQVTEDVEIKGNIRRTALDQVPGISPLIVKRGSRVFIRKDSRSKLFEVEVVGSKTATTVWFILTEDEFGPFIQKTTTQSLRAGRRNPLRGRGVRRLKVLTRVRSPFV